MAWVSLCACTEHCFCALEGKTNFCRCSTLPYPSHRDWGGGAWRLGRIAVARPGEHMYESEFGGERGVSLWLRYSLWFCLGLWREPRERLPRKHRWRWEPNPSGSVGSFCFSFTSCLPPLSALSPFALSFAFTVWQSCCMWVCLFYSACYLLHSHN